MDDTKVMHVEIVTPQKVVFEGQALSVTVPGAKSSFQILYNHAPIVSALENGLVRIVDEKDNAKWFATSSGFAEVLKNKISILVESADDAGQLDRQAVESEIQKLDESIKNASGIEEALLFKDKLAIERNKLKALQSIER